MSTTKKKKSTSGSLLELVLIVATALALALGIQAFLVKPYRIPSESMEPTLQVGQRVLVNRIGTRFTDPKVGDVIVFHPPQGSQDNRCGVPPVAGRACSLPTRGRSDVNFIKRVVGAPGDRISIVDGRVIRNGRSTVEKFIKPCTGGEECTSEKFTTLARPRDPDQVVEFGTKVFVAAHGDKEVLAIDAEKTNTWAPGVPPGLRS